MNKNINQYFQNAFTSTPIQDKFNQLGFLPNGLSRVEYIALQILQTNINVTLISKNKVELELLIIDAINTATLFINEIDNYKKSLETPATDLKIIP